MCGLRDKVVTVRVNSELLEEFKKAVNKKEKNYYKKTNASDLIEKAMQDYIKAS